MTKIRTLLALVAILVSCEKEAIPVDLVNVDLVNIELRVSDSFVTIAKSGKSSKTLSVFNHHINSTSSFRIFNDSDVQVFNGGLTLNPGAYNSEDLWTLSHSNIELPAGDYRLVILPTWHDLAPIRFTSQLFPSSTVNFTLEAGIQEPLDVSVEYEQSLITVTFPSYETSIPTTSVKHVGDTEWTTMIHRTGGVRYIYTNSTSIESIQIGDDVFPMSTLTLEPMRHYAFVASKSANDDTSGGYTISTWEAWEYNHGGTFNY